MADPLGDALVIEQCVDQRDLGRRDDRGQTHRLPQRHDRKNQQCGQRPETERQGIPMTSNRNVTPRRRTTATELEFGGLVEQDDRQRQLGDDGEARGVGGTLDELEAERPQHNSEEDEDQRRRQVPAA